MEANITNETLNINKVICEKKETIEIQGDIIVPDSKPDILSAINTSGNISIYKKEVARGKVKIDGNILTYVMYLAEEPANQSTSNMQSSQENQNSQESQWNKEDSTRGLSTNLDFSENINVPEVDDGMSVDIVSKLKNIECKVINGRKISITATMEIVLKVHMQEQIEIIADIDNSNLQILREEMKVNSLIGDGMAKASVKENISVPNTDNLAEILNMEIRLVDKDIKISYNKVLAKADVEIDMIYLTEDGRVCASQSRLPLVGFIDMPNITDQNTCETTYLTKNILVKPNSIEEHTVYVEFETEIYCLAYEEKEIHAIRDMYCPGEKMSFNNNDVKTIANKQCKKNICNIMEKVNIPELENANIISVTVRPIVNQTNKTNGKIRVVGEAEAKVFFLDNSNVGINTKQISIPFDQTIENIEIEEDCEIEINVYVDSQEFLNQDGVISANIAIGIEVSSQKKLVVPVISNVLIEDEENQEDYSVVIYVVKSGDTLWKIAKKFASTVDDIARVNGMEKPDKLSVGEKIYIPKYVLNRAKDMTYTT